MGVICKGGIRGGGGERPGRACQHCDYFSFLSLNTTLGLDGFLLVNLGTDCHRHNCRSTIYIVFASRCGTAGKGCFNKRTDLTKSKISRSETNFACNKLERYDNNNDRAWNV